MPPHLVVSNDNRPASREAPLPTAGWLLAQRRRQRCVVLVGLLEEALGVLELSTLYATVEHPPATEPLPGNNGQLEIGKR